MTIEDQIVALFARANPVPSLDVFDAVEPLDIDRLEMRPERSSEVTATKTDKVMVEGPGRWRRLAPVLAIPVIVGVGPGSPDQQGQHGCGDAAPVNGLP